MKYVLNKLNPTEFEGLIQSLSRAIVGSGTISFGEGTDGGREATFNGKGDFPSLSGGWDGYWVIQAKHKELRSDQNIDDFSWVKKELLKEMEKFAKRKVKVENPNNYLFFTNAKLTAKPKTGGRDKASAIEREYEKKYGILNIRIISQDDILEYLEINRDIAVSYAPFILPGDILFKILELVDKGNARNQHLNELICRLLEEEFKEDIQSKLDHAGKLSSEKINLEKVFVDLPVYVSEGSVNQVQNFIEMIIQTGNNIIRYSPDGQKRFVLIAGPGYGKSTLTQFLTQIYRAYFLRDLDKSSLLIPEVTEFLVDFKSIIDIQLKWIRLPFKVILKDYAGWVKESRFINPDANISVIKFLLVNITKKTAGVISEEEIENLFSRLPCLFIFDGLDEVPASSNREIILKEINFFTDTVLRRIDCDAIIISTTRPQGYSREFDESKYSHFVITEMTKKDCELYLSRLLNNIIDDKLTRANKMQILMKALSHKEVSRIMKTPLQASIMAILVKIGGEPPTNKYDLFTEYFSTIFNREKQRAILPIISVHAQYVKDIHYILGLYLQTVSEINDNPSAIIEKSKFKLIIDGFLNQKGISNHELEEKSKMLVEATTDRLVFISEIEDEKIGFAIRSLQEFFAAYGYVHGVKDEEVMKRIKMIAPIAYWNNTMLFIVAYLAKNKPFMVDFIDSICGELNGNTDGHKNKSLESIAKVGSWFALDILNEGIFADNPRNENKFTQHLQVLLQIDFIDKHLEISLLPENIINGFLQKFINEALERSHLNRTPWRIISELMKSHYDFNDLLRKYWPNDPLKSMNVASCFMEEGGFNDFVLNQFLASLNISTLGEVHKLLVRKENFSFFQALSSFDSNNNSHGLLFDLVFITTLHNHDDIDFNSLLESYGLELSKHRNDFQYIPSNESFTKTIVEGYRYSIVKPNAILSKDVQKSIKKIASNNGSQLILKFYNFCYSNTFANFQDLKSFIDSTPEMLKKYIWMKLKYTNSFFKLSQDRDLSQKEYDAIINRLNDVSEKNFEEYDLIENLDITVRRTLTLSGLNEKLDNFVSQYLTDSSTANALIIYRMLFISCHDRMSVAEISEISEIQIKLYLRSLSLPWDNDLKSLSFRFASSLHFFKPKEVKSAVNIYDEAHEDFVLTLYFSTIPNNENSFYSGYFVLCGVIKLQLLLNEKVSYRTLLQMIFASIGIYGKNEVSNIPFNEILKEDDEELSLSKAIILLFDPELSEHGLLYVKRTFVNKKKEVESSSDQDAFILVLKHLSKNKQTEELLIFLHEQRDVFSDVNKNKLLSFIRRYVGNFTSGLEISDDLLYGS